MSIRDIGRGNWPCAERLAGEARSLEADPSPQAAVAAKMTTVEACRRAWAGDWALRKGRIQTILPLSLVPLEARGGSLSGFM